KIEMKNLTLALFLIFLGNFAAFGQKSKSPPKTAETIVGAISGTVSDETGSPIEDAQVSIYAVGSQKLGESFKETTDRGGNFNFENLKPRRYKISVRYAGYVLPEEFETSPENQKTYLVNQPVNLIVRKGGAITGKVVDNSGQPIIRVRVRAVRIRDEFGQKIAAQEFARYSQQNFTDDRGIYRIFGLTAGSYLIFVGGGDTFSEQNLTTKENSPVYHPSDSVDTAEEIRVGYGQEANSVDINFRQIQGFRVSGTITGAKSNASNNGRVGVSLVNAANGVEIVQTNVFERDGKYAFKIEQIPDGEYEIRALQFGERGVFSKNSLQKIKIKGADISGLTLNLKTLNSIKGNISVEKNPNLAAVKECAKVAETALTSMIVKFDSGAKEKSVLDSLESIQQNIFAAPDENGDFEINRLESGRYFLNVNFPGENLFVKQISQKISDKEKRDLNGGLGLGAGENLDNVKIVFSDGAAKINGKIIVSEKEKVENSSAKFIVFLIPADEANKDNILRYAQTVVNIDETFSFENVAPGNYFLSAENFPADKEAVQKSRISKFWDAKERMKLFQDAKNGETALTLKPCQNSIVEIKIKDVR
ncbi:MAG: carboxypeptidase-like regulatory domain-containing protein, partial [Acidobacteriota bacterium]